MSIRKHIQLYRTSGDTAPIPGNVMYGELAMGYKSGSEKLYFKNTNDDITTFSSDEQIKAVRDQQDGKLAQAAGLVTQLSQSGEVSYAYVPSAETLTEFDTMSESVDYLASQVKDCMDAIENFKHNIYTIDTNFSVIADSGVTSYTASYSCTNNGNPTTPSACTITRYVNDGSGTVILDNTSTPSSAVTVSVSGSKEKYVLEVVPIIPNALNIRSEETKYICMVGATSATTMTAEIAAGFKKYVSNGKWFVAKDVETESSQYVWIIVPSYISVRFATSQGITFPLSEDVQTVSDIDGITGTYRCYRSNQELDDATWNIVVHNLAN